MTLDLSSLIGILRPPCPTRAENKPGLRQRRSVSFVEPADDTSSYVTRKVSYHSIAIPPEQLDSVQLSTKSGSRPPIDRQVTTESMRAMKQTPLDREKYPKDETNVWYMTPEERQAFKLGCDKNGRLIDAQGNPLIPHKEYRYVTDRHRNFYASLAANDQHIQHSSYLAGNDVTSAGKMQIITRPDQPNKYFIFINNYTGHYKCDPQMLDQAIDILVRMGVDRKNIKRQVFVQNGTKA